MYSATLIRPAFKMLQLAAPLGIALYCVTALQPTLSSLDPAGLLFALAQLSPVNWALALLASFASFWAVGRYDVVLHRHFATGVRETAAQHSGAAAIAVGQLLGFGLVTGAFVRWRLLPELGPLRSAAITGLCAASFLAALAATAALVGLLTNPLDSALWALPVLALGLALVLLAFLHPAAKLGRMKPFRMPTLPAIGALLGLTFLDTLFAALALWVLIGGAAVPAFPSLYLAFLLALGAGLLSGAPAGLGAFEVTLFALLPQVPTADLALAILGFRAVYYVLPAAIAGLYLVQPARHGAQHKPKSQPVCERQLATARRAELGVARQNGATLFHAADTALALARTPQTLTMLFDPLCGPIGGALPEFMRHARASNRIPMAYKCSARSALALRLAGFCVLRIADEAVLNPTRFTLDSPRRKTLRRKLRKAAKANLRTERAQALPLPDMHAIDAEWSAEHGPARGFSMGRFCADYLACQRVYLAYQGAELVAFVSFHATPNEFCLDLMRARKNAPDGTMQALIQHAIEDARNAGLTRLSLAALPAEHGPRLLTRLVSAPGLAQFKLGFAPRLEPLYAAAPTRMGLAVGLCDIARTIAQPERACEANEPHNHLDDYEFA